MKKPKQTRRRKRVLTQADRLRWLQLNHKPQKAGRLPRMYADSLHVIDEETLAGLTLALYQVMLNAPRGQEGVVANKRTLTLIVPHDFRSRYGRRFPMGRALGLTPDRWYIRYSVRCVRLYDYLYGLGLMAMPRSAFSSLASSVRHELRHLEKSLDNLIPSEILEKIEEKINKEVLDSDNGVVDNNLTQANNQTGE